MQNKCRIIMVMLLSIVVLGVSAVSIAPVSAKGNTLTVALNTEPLTMNAILATDTTTDYVLQHFLEKLFIFDPDEGILPYLVQDYTLSEDALVWTMVLHRGIRFHDGTPLNADAVIYNLELFLDPATAHPYTWLLEPIREVKKVDEYTFQIITEEPFLPLAANLCHHTLSIQSPTAMKEQGEDYGNPPVGTGPFRFVEWKRGERITLTRNNDYWGDQPQYDKLVFLPIREEATRVFLLRTGEVDVAIRIPASQLLILDNHRDTYVINTPTVRRIYLGFNLVKEPVDNVLIRRAIYHAIDRESIVKHILYGAGEVMTSAIPKSIEGYYNTGLYDYNPQRAKELLIEAGYPNGFDLVFHHPTGRYTQDERIAQAIASQLDAVGIRTKLVTMDWAAYNDFVRQTPEKAQFSMFLLGGATVTGDPDYGMRPTTHSTAWAPVGSNRVFYASAIVDEALDRARAELDYDKRMEYYKIDQEAITADVPMIYLHVENLLVGVRKGIEGVKPHPGETVNFSSVTIRR